MAANPDWLFPLRRPSETATSRLIVFPYAAGGASAMRPMVRGLPASVDVLGVALPGRERRFDERPATSLSEVVNGLEAGLSDRPALPIHLFGHSMGASLAAAVAVKLPGRYSGLVLSGRRPHRVAFGHVLSLSDNDIVDFLSEAGNTNPRLLAEPFWRSRLVELFRSDVDLDIEASSVLAGSRLTERILAIGGRADPYVNAADLSGWAACTTGPCRVMTLPGGHFFLLESQNQDSLCNAVTAAINEACKSS